MGPEDRRVALNADRLESKKPSTTLPCDCAGQAVKLELRLYLPGDGSELKPWRKKEWCIPKVSAEFVARMEDVLDLYAEPYDPKRPVVCFDETSKQLVSEKRSPIPAKAGRRERFDYEYQRNGTRNLFMTCEPLAWLQ